MFRFFKSAGNEAGEEGNLLEWKATDRKNRFLMRLHARIDSGNGDDTLGPSNTPLPRVRKYMWWQVWFHF